MRPGLQRQVASARMVYMTGFMGAGKSTVGRALAKELGWQFVDLDEAVETRAGWGTRFSFDLEAHPVGHL